MLDWKEVLGSLNEGIMVALPSSEIVWANAAYCSLTGYELHELIGKTPAILRSPQTRPEDIEALWDTLRAAGRAITRLVNKRADGTLFHAELSIARIVDPQDGTLFVSSMRDVSVEVETEARLDVARAQAEVARDITIESLASLAEQRDSDTGAHLVRIEAYVALMGEWVLDHRPDCLPAWARDVPTLARCSILHDIGKVGIPDAVLRKKGPLTPEEQAVMREHPRLGAQILDRVLEHQPESAFLRVARDVVAYHHEAWDGRGYPYGLAGEAIPMAAQLTAVADVFDALTSKRPYKPAHRFDDAVAYIEQRAGLRFGPVAVEALVANASKFRDIHAEFGDRETPEPIRPSGIDRMPRVAEPAPGVTPQELPGRPELLSALREGIFDLDGGEVVVRSGLSVGRILFHRGRVAWIALSTDTTLLRDVLQADLGLSTEDVDDVVADCKRTGVDFTSALAKWGLVDPERLREAIRKFLAARLAALLAIARPVALFVPASRSFGGEFTFSITDLTGELPPEFGPSPARP